MDGQFKARGVARGRGRVCSGASLVHPCPSPDARPPPPFPAAGPNLTLTQL